jgi:hypothetical protein
VKPRLDVHDAVIEALVLEHEVRRDGRMRNRQPVELDVSEGH